MRRRAVVAAVLVVSLVVGAVPTAAEAPRQAAVVAPAPSSAAIVDTLPPGARNIVAALRILKGLSARNRVYREARGVQRDLRAYYDAQIETAREQLLNREQLGLEPSQVRAYQRVKARLEAERDAALGITEDEKRAAKYGFESTLVRELTGALLRVPRIRQGLERAKEAIDDVRGAFERAKAAIEGGNPITDLVGELRGKLDDLDRFAELGGLINGNLGRQLGNISAAARRELDRVEAAVDEAAGAAESAIGELDAVTAGIDEGLESSRTVRADAALEQAAADLIDRVFAPGGSGGPPEIDVIADALARDALTPAQENVGVAVGVIDPGEFRRMRDRVHASMLGRSLERIGDICGRLVGAARRAQLAAAAAGQPAPDTSSPCTLFGDPQALQDIIDAERASATTTTDTQTTAPEEAATDDGQPGTGGSEQGQAADGRYVGSLDDPGSVFDVEVGNNSVEVVVEGGSVTEFSVRSSGRYSACFGGYGVEDEVSCTVWLTWDLALSGGSVAISEGSTDVSMTATQEYSDCESELASECKDWDYTEVEAVTARISFTDETMTASFLVDGQAVGVGFTAIRQ